MNELVEAADDKQPGNTIARHGRPAALRGDRGPAHLQLTFNATPVETGTESYRLARTKIRGRAATRDTAR